MGTNIPASALSISNSLIGFNPLYALQSRPSHPRSSIESYNNARTQQPQHNPYYQQPSSHGTVPDSGKHSYAPSQPLLISAANINMKHNKHRIINEKRDFVGIFGDHLK